MSRDEQCESCGRNIGNNEQACLFGNLIVCACCKSRLARKEFFVWLMGGLIWKGRLRLGHKGMVAACLVAVLVAAVALLFIGVGILGSIRFGDGAKWIGFKVFASLAFLFSSSVLALGGIYSLMVTKPLIPSMPTLGPRYICTRCGRRRRGLAKFCTACGWAEMSKDG